jgi:hypothetical protein
VIDAQTVAVEFKPEPTYYCIATRSRSTAEGCARCDREARSAAWGDEVGSELR